jgi:putative ABC transport system substrate-binding protein
MAKKDIKKLKAKKKVRATTHRVGVLHTGKSDNFEDLVKLIKPAADTYLLSQGSNDKISIFQGGHYANDDLGVLDDLAYELVNNTNVEVIVAAGGPQSAIAAMDATNEADGSRSVTPVVFTTVADPVGLGLVESLATPGYNLTGMAGETSENDPTRLELLHEFVKRVRPTAKKVGVLINPARQGYPKQFRDLKKKAKSLNLKLVVRRAKKTERIASAFAKFRGAGFLGAVVTADSFFNNNRATVIEEAKIEGGVPTIYQWRSFAEDGGLISYGPSIQYAYEEAGRYVARIILGEDPKDMECSAPGSCELVVNGETAKKFNLYPVVSPIGTTPIDETL